MQEMQGTIVLSSCIVWLVLWGACERAKWVSVPWERALECAIARGEHARVERKERDCRG
jgi:hypothetical protein